MPTAISARITPADEAKLRSIADRLGIEKGVEFTLTDAFGWLLDQQPDTFVKVAPATSFARVTFGASLSDEQLATLDRIAGELAQRRAVVTGNATPNRSEAVRYVIRSAR